MPKKAEMIGISYKFIRSCNDSDFLIIWVTNTEPRLFALDVLEKLLPVIVRAKRT